MLFIHDEKFKRSVMSVIFLILFMLPFVLDAYNVADSTRLFIYRVGFILWAQIFLLDAFAHYQQTQSKQWLIITNVAVVLIVIGAIVI